MLTCEAILLRHILKNMGEKQEVAKSIKIDNQSLIMSPENWFQSFQRILELFKFADFLVSRLLYCYKGFQRVRCFGGVLKEYAVDFTLV